MTYIKNTGELGYLELVKDVLDNGVSSGDRTGTGTLRVFSRLLRFDLREGLPLVTTKKVPFRSVLSELLWFIEGSGDNERLKEILYGEHNEDLDNKTTIWTDNAESPYWRHKAQYPGDLGRVYGVQWRHWRAPRQAANGDWYIEEIDQLALLIEGLKKDPNGRRHILSAWNPGELEQMALPPCHKDAHFIIIDGVLNCKLEMRSWDLFLGASFNIASYALLTMMIAQVCGYSVGELTIHVTDAHIYLDHIEQAKELISRTPYNSPKVEIDSSITDIDDFRMEHFKLIDYKCHPKIEAKMAV